MHQLSEQILDGVDEECFAGFTPQEVEQTAEFLSRMAENLLVAEAREERDEPNEQKENACL